MTEDDWKEVETRLSGVFGMVKLRVEGRMIMFHRAQVATNRLGIMTYIDGEFRGIWMRPGNACPESRFLRPRAKYIYPARVRSRVSQASAKERQQIRKLNPNFLDHVDKKLHYFDPIWPNARAIRRHYAKTFREIELLYPDPADRQSAENRCQRDETAVD